MVAEAALPPQDDSDRFDHTERQQDARLPHQDLFRILEVDRLQRVHAQLAHGKHPKIERIQIEENLVRQARIAHLVGVGARQHARPPDTAPSPTFGRKSGRQWGERPQSAAAGLSAAATSDVDGGAPWVAHRVCCPPPTLRRRIL